MKEQRYFSGISYVSADRDWLLAVGSSASAFSNDGLKSWQFLAPTGFNAVSSQWEYGVSWAVGANGSVAKARLGECGAPCVQRK